MCASDRGKLAEGWHEKETTEVATARQSGRRWKAIGGKLATEGELASTQSP
jgi:hypothetical protein